MFITLIKYLAKSLENTAILFCNELFKGNHRYMFLIGFTMVTFGIPFILILVGLGFVNIYARLYLKKFDSENWGKYHKDNFTFYKDYKKWLKGEGENDNVFFKVYKKYEQFGKICFYIWIVFIAIVAITVIIVDKFNLQF